jgi:hypothetical protein
MPLRRAIALRLCALACLLGAASWSFAADAPAEAGPPADPAAKDALAAPADDALLTELSTAGFYELAARARELGLSDAGAAEELRARLYAHYGLKAPAAGAAGRIVTIEKAARASYAKVEEGEGGIVRASGGVVLGLVEANGDSHRIEADSIAFDRTRSTLTARGRVRYERKSGTTIEVFSGEALSANLDDWSGVFIDGKMRRAGEATASGERGLVIAADTILRRSSDVMVLEDGVISSCDAEDPHYSVRAGRVWLLGDKEWAVSDALFSLGNVPLLWLPFFYYPGDEIVFHPVIGFRSREGTFLQTTTYLVGHKPAKKETTSILSFKQSGADKPTELKGLFLRRVAGPAPKDEGTLKAMADVYSGLGAFAGIQGSFPKAAFLDKTDFFAGLGLSRTLYPTSSGFYSPYFADGNWASVWNGSDFLGLRVPYLRYGLDLTASLRSGGLTATLALPLYSDPYFDQDFRNRTEDMDWMRLLSASADTSTSPSIRSTLSPSFTSSLSLKPKGLDPWLSSVEISRLGASMTLPAKVATLAGVASHASYDPQYQFFYPSLLRPIDAAATLRGSLFGNSPTSAPAGADTAGSAAAPAELRSPWEEGTEAAGAKAEGAVGPATDPTALPQDAPDADFRLPQRAPDAAAAVPASWTASSTWSLSPSAYLEDRYLSAGWASPEDISFSSLDYRLLSYRVAASLDTSLAWGDLLSSSLGLTYADQDLSRDADPSTAASYVQGDYLYKSRRVGAKAAIAIKPFASSWLWSATSLSWGMDSTVYSLKYDSSLATPAFTEAWLGWDQSMITSHNVSLNLAARPGGLSQSLSLTASLPPTLESYSAQLGLNAALASLRVQSRMYRKSIGAGFSFDPVTAGVTIGAAPGPTLSDTMVYDAAGVGWTSNTTGLAWGAFSASFTGKRTVSWTFDKVAGWSSTPTESFQWSDFSLGLKPQLKSAEGSAAAWSVGADLSLSQSLLRFTESNLSFGLNASLKVGDELNLSISSQSANASAWHYYPRLFASQLASIDLARSADDYFVNPLVDIAESLAIWDGAALRKSLFKLKSLSFKASRDLHDWTLSAEVSTKPLYDSALKNYTLDTSFTILLAWKDIPDIKSTIKKDSTGLSY